MYHFTVHVSLHHLQGVPLHCACVIILLTECTTSLCMCHYTTYRVYHFTVHVSLYHLQSVPLYYACMYLHHLHSVPLYCACVFTPLTQCTTLLCMYLYTTDEQFKHKFALTTEGVANFSIIHFNCRSLASNFNKLKDSTKALGLQFDVIAISETWLSDNDSDNFNIHGYTTFTCSRIYKKGDGVALYINNSLQHKYLPNKSKCIDNCAEAVSVEITF